MSEIDFFVSPTGNFSIITSDTSRGGARRDLWSTGHFDTNSTRWPRGPTSRPWYWGNEHVRHLEFQSMSRFILMSGTGRIKLFHQTLLQFVQGQVEVRSAACGLVPMKPWIPPRSFNTFVSGLFQSFTFAVSHVWHKRFLIPWWKTREQFRSSLEWETTSTLCDARTCGTRTDYASCSCVVRRFSEWENTNASSALLPGTHVDRPSTPCASLYPRVGPFDRPAAQHAMCVSSKSAPRSPNVRVERWRARPGSGGERGGGGGRDAALDRAHSPGLHLRAKKHSASHVHLSPSIAHDAARYEMKSESSKKWKEGTLQYG